MHLHDRDTSKYRHNKGYPSSSPSLLSHYSPKEMTWTLGELRWVTDKSHLLHWPNHCFDASAWCIHDLFTVRLPTRAQCSFLQDREVFLWLILTPAYPLGKLGAPASKKNLGKGIAGFWSWSTASTDLTNRYRQNTARVAMNSLMLRHKGTRKGN